MMEVSVEDAGSIGRQEALALYRSVGWTAYASDPDRLMAAITGSHRIVTARAGGELVGLARSVSDGASILFLQDLLVKPSVQRTGLGTRLVEALFSLYPARIPKLLLTDTEPRQRAFYESLGFTEIHEHEPTLRSFVRLTV